MTSKIKEASAQIALTRTCFLNPAPCADDEIGPHEYVMFYQDPYVYYETYVKSKLPKPSAVQSVTEQILKTRIAGDNRTMVNMDFNAPVNPSTGKPYGEGTQKFEAWASTVREEGRVPIHPDASEAAQLLYDQLMYQAEYFYPPLDRIISSICLGGPVQERAEIENMFCRAGLDILYTIDPEKPNYYGGLLVFTTHSLDSLKESKLLACGLMADLGAAVIETAKPGVEIAELASLMIESMPPYRVTLFPHIRGQERSADEPIGYYSHRHVKVNLKALSDAWDDPTEKLWKSPWHR